MSEKANFIGFVPQSMNPVRGGTHLVYAIEPLYARRPCPAQNFAPDLACERVNTVRSRVSGFASSLASG